MYVETLRHRARTSLYHAIELGRGIADDGSRCPALASLQIRGQRAVVGDDHPVAIVEQEMDRLAFERVYILRKDEGVGAFTHQGVCRQREYVFEAVDADM